MDVNEILPPPDGEVEVTSNGVVICSLNTLMRWTDNWMRTAELRLMLSKREEIKWAEKSGESSTSGKAQTHG